MSPILAAVVTVLSAGAAGAGEPPAGPQPAAPRDYSAPPPGASAADQALWKRTRWMNNQILIERGFATRLQARARGNGYVERLAALAKEGALPARTADDLTERIHARWRESASLLTRQWPVDPTRSCRAPLLVFEGVLYREDSPGKRAQLDDARKILQGCVDRGTVPLEALTKLNGEFEAVLAEADRAIAEALARAPQPGAAAAPAAASTSTAAPATTDPVAGR